MNVEECSALGSTPFMLIVSVPCAPVLVTSVLFSLHLNTNAMQCVLVLILLWLMLLLNIYYSIIVIRNNNNLVNADTNNNDNNNNNDIHV